MLNFGVDNENCLIINTIFKMRSHATIAFDIRIDHKYDYYVATK